MSDGGVEQREIEEWRCPKCGWLEPEYQSGDPALCPNCGVEYPLNRDERIRNWSRCIGWNDDGSKCDRKTPEEHCHDHKEIATDGGQVDEEKGEQRRIEVIIKSTRIGNLATFADASAGSGVRSMTDAEIDAHDFLSEIANEIDAEAHESGDLVAEVFVDSDGECSVEWADDAARLATDGGEKADGGESQHFDVHCSRCGTEYPRERENTICENCEKRIQLSKLMDGVRCTRCEGHGWIHGSICDIQRAMNGRDTRCPECHGSGRVAWDPDREDTHPDLRTEVMARVE